MKILIDLTSLDDNFSGIERYALNITKNLILIDNGNKYILVFKNKVHNEFKQFEYYANVEISILKGSNKLIFNQIILPYNLYKLKADQYLFLAFPSPILFKSKNIINTIHDLTPWDYPQTMKKLSCIYFKYSIINAIRVSERILTVSNYSKSQIEKRFKNKIKEINIIYNGVSDVFLTFDYDIEKNNEVKRKYGLPDNYLMCLCTLEPRKNLILLINAFIELKESNKLKGNLVLVGRKGWKIDDLLSNIQSPYKEDIIITGFVEDIDLPYIYHNADLFVFPSLYEGFGIPVIEAMAMGVPVISSDSSSLPEVVEEEECLFKSNDLNDLKNKLVLFLNKDNLDKKNISQKLLISSKRFNWNNEAKKLFDIISNSDNL